nr:MAG TPA: hypothetical protein [Caudoviricetes sp.]
MRIALVKSLRIFALLGVLILTLILLIGALLFIDLNKAQLVLVLYSNLL